MISSQSANLYHNFRNVRFLLQLNDVQCTIDSPNEDRCEDYIQKATAAMCQDNIHINFIYNFTNVGLACVKISNITADLSTLGTRTNFIDNTGDHLLCMGETFTVTDKRTTSTLCDDFASTWDVVIEVTDNKNRTNKLEYQYESADASTSPSLTPTLTHSPSAVVDNDCIDCVLYSSFSGSE